MHKSHLGLALGFAAAVLVASRTHGQTPPSGCTPNVTVEIDDSMPSVPNLTVDSQVAWTSAQAFTVTFTPQNSHNPYPQATCTHVNSTTTCYSCPPAAGTTSPVTYQITFTNSNKKIYGHIIITKPIGK